MPYNSACIVRPVWWTGSGGECASGPQNHTCCSVQLPFMELLHLNRYFMPANTTRHIGQVTAGGTGTASLAAELQPALGRCILAGPSVVGLTLVLLAVDGVLHELVRPLAQVAVDAVGCEQKGPRC